MAQGNEVAKKQATPVDKLKQVLASDSIQQQFKNALADNANLFTASLVDLYAGDSYLQKCEPALVVLEALKAATLKLPISKSLGFAYIIAYGGKPQFILGYKGLVQLAMRSGVYRCINAGTVYEGELRSSSKLTGEIDLTGTKTSENPIGYFAYIETINGFKKTMYCNIDDMREHGKKYSKSYNQHSSPWKKEFDGMAEKTMLRMLLGKYGQMSIDMADGMADGMAQEADPDYVGDGGYSDNGNKDFIDVDTDTGEVKQVDDTEASTEADLKKEMDPGY